jgi:hypothetical protein
VAGGAEIPPLAEVGQEVLVAAAGAADAGKTLAEVATGEIVPDYLGDNGSEVTLGSKRFYLINLFGNDSIMAKYSPTAGGRGPDISERTLRPPCRCMYSAAGSLPSGRAGNLVRGKT